MSDDAPRDLSVVVVAYGSVTTLEKALGELGGRRRVVVVDNASDPATAALAERFHARYIDPGTNLGFAAGVNRALGLLALPETDVLLLNPDARIAEDAVAELHRTLRADPQLAAVAPAVHRDGSGRETPGRLAWHSPRGAWAEALGVRDGSRSNGFLSGAVLLVRGEALADVGMFDERFFLYAEDEDWQRRAVERGWQLRSCPDIVAWHDRGGSEADLSSQQLRLHAATERYVRKWYGRRGWFAFRSAVVAGQLARAVVRPGWRRRSALGLARTYVTGPVRLARRAGVLPSRAAREG